MPGIETATKSASKCREVETPKVFSTIDPNTVLNNVLRQLGKPSNMTATNGALTRATPVDQHTFRVQIYVQEDCKDIMGTHARLAGSFWVKVNDDGAIMRSDPAIEKIY